MNATIRLKGFNFFYFSMFALFISFLPVYMAKVGVSKTHLGFILGLGSVVCIVSQPFWGVISDKYRTVRKVLLLLILLSVLSGSFLFQSVHLWSLLPAVLLMNLFFLPTDPLVESLNFRTTQAQKVSYGSVRMFGALGYAITSLLAGGVLAQWGMDSLAWIFAGAGLLALLLAFGLADVETSAKPVLVRHLRSFLLKRDTIALLVVVFAVAIPHKMNDIFIGLYMDELGGSMRLTGMSWFVMTIMETIMFAASSRLIRPGREGLLMTIAAGLYAVRFLLSSFVTDPYELVGLQIFQGFTFVLFYVGALQYLYSIVPEEWKSTGQTMVTVLFFGVSGIIGSGIGGWLLDELGGAWLYRIMAALAVAGFVLCMALLGRRRTSQEQA
ncbi:MFS transporter [Cohnella faecalis]|uniref:MFS transporter n=1 Tax=Cohnella faecalis TaxID=2315694 RepID=A0A398CLR3_9BACL|nr:MFS transporter [Cohnella faecalis]RIE02159.1 MFS transporter [Cohnella faecalis]